MITTKVINRIINIDLPRSRSAFLWGARKVGKTTFLKQKYGSSTYYDLLKTDLFIEFNKEPSRFREELIALKKSGKLKQPIIVDEVQKVPKLLDEIHLLIEQEKMSFILCGSSARKLKRTGVNLLGGRAWRFSMLPLATKELGKSFDLLIALNRGLIPAHYFDDHYERTIRSYVNDYLKEEIRDEGLTRNLRSFSQFLEIAAISNSQMINYSNIARDCGVDTKTVIEYYQILLDTHLGYLIEPYKKKKKRQIIENKPKFYFFDTGVVSSMNQRVIKSNKGAEFGNAFEHFILMELIAFNSYKEKDVSINYWRTKVGDEVDFIIDKGKIAIEVKGAKRIDRNDLKSMRIFIDEHSPKRAIVISQEPRMRVTENGIEIVPWRSFLKMLWDGKIF